MTPKEYSESIKIFSEAIFTIIEEHGMKNQLSGPNQTNPHFFTGNLSKMVSKELAWLGTDWEAKYDMLAQAFTNIMLHRADTLFNNFKTKESGKQKAGMEQFLTFIFSRELSGLSQKEYKRIKKEKQVNPIDDESYDAAFERVIQSKPTLNQNRIDGELEDLDSVMADYENVIKRYKKEKPENWEGRIEIVKGKITKLEKKKDTLIKEAKFSMSVESTIESKLSIDEELVFEQLVSMLKKELRKEPGESDTYVTILEMLIAGFGKSDIARFLGVSAARVSKRISKIKELLWDMGERMYRKTKNFDLLEALTEGFLHIKATVGVRDVMTIEDIEKQTSVLGIKRPK